LFKLLTFLNNKGFAMKKNDVITLMGSQQKVADLLGIKQASVAGWPDDLPIRIADRVIGAMHRQKIKVPKEWLKAG
jgi:hypothetical protein